MRMNKTLKIITGVGIVSIVAAMFVVLANQDTDTKEVVANPSVDKQLVEPVEIAKIAVTRNGVTQTQTPAEQIKQQINSLIVQADQAYMDIINLTGEYETRPLNYDDNWCVPSEDLSEQDNIFVKKRIDEWKLNHVNIVPQEQLEKVFGAEKYAHLQLEGVNDEYLAPYKDADRDTLIRLAKQDDIFALYTLQNDYNKYQLDWQSLLIISEQLVMLGDTNMGLNTLVIENLSRAKIAMRENQKDDAVDFIKSALALVEFGIIRNDITIISSIFFSDEKMADVTSNIMSSLTESDYAEINQKARGYYKQFNKARAERGLTNFDDMDEGKITDAIHARKLSLLYMQYEDLLTDSLIPQRWKEDYLRVTPCAQRLIARRNFRQNELPEFRQKIADLEKRLTALLDKK